MKVGTSRSPKLHHLAKILGITRRDALGLLSMLWEWTWEQAPRGDVGRWPDESIALACEWAGDPAELVAALVESGWLDRCEKTRLLIHDYADHAPEFVKKRLSRNGQKPHSQPWRHTMQSAAPNGGQCLPNGGPRGVERSGEEKSREEKREHTSGTTPDTGALEQKKAPDLTASPAFKALAAEICNMLNSRTGSKFKPESKTVAKLLKGRMADGHPPHEIVRVVNAKITEWLPDEKMRKFLRPATLLAREKFESYVGQAEVKPPAGPPELSVGKRPPPDSSPCASCPHTEGEHGMHPQTGERYCRLCVCPPEESATTEPETETAEVNPW